MDKIAPTILTVVVIAAVFGLMGLGWRNRIRRQSTVAPLTPIPAGLKGPDLAVDGQYVVTTTAGDWLDRLAVHGLGIRTNAVLEVYPEGAVFDRSGAPDLFIPAAALTGVRYETGMAGKFVEKDGLVVLTWRLGETAVDTGFRTRHAADKAPITAALRDLITAQPQANAKNGKN